MMRYLLKNGAVDPRGFSEAGTWANGTVWLWHRPGFCAGSAHELSYGLHGSFVLLFEENKGRIAGHKGCRFVYLLRCGDTFFTISGWDRPEDLETYRTSALFRDVWKQTKSWLSEPAQAWSCPITDWALHGA